MKLKPGASLRGVKDVMFESAIVVEDVFEGFGYHATITSGTDSLNLHGHGDPKKTLHDDGLALDWRTRGLLEETKQSIAAEIRARLALRSKCYQVVVEEDHIHTEYDTHAPDAIV